PTLAYGVAATLCNDANGSIDLTVSGGAAPFAFAWSNGANTEDATQLSAGVYGVTLTDGNGCSVDASIAVQAISPGTVGVNGVQDSICAGSSFAVTAFGATSYIWSPGTGLDTTAGETVNITAPQGNTTYFIVGTDANGCIDTMSFTVEGMPYANQLSVHDAYLGCNPYDVQLECEPENAIDVQWWFSNNTSANGANATMTFTTGVYDAMLVTISPYGCNDTLFLENYITVLQPPTANFSSEGIILDPSIPPVTFDFTNLSTGATSYEWLFGGFGTDTATNPQFTFPDPGFYDVMLIATSDSVCYDTISRRIEVEVPHNLFVPNTFTPNGDGVNDLFTVYGDGIRKFHLRIYDRWGTRVFESNGHITGWDGTYQGQEMNTAVFVYIADIELLDGFSIKKTGDITLLR
ncbi:MAG TPA: gliding motility-associated C-terminal domain-containing protein, partial [Chitinophagales bacterium]|nr:gliding motility-associated C-terminal domain-containing protein [Chitinophagales bacterium]